jgi:hypothetical protein
MDQSPALRERRISPRLEAVRNRFRLEFGTPSGLRRGAAEVVDDSREGARVVAERPPALHAVTWVRMEEPVKTDRVAAVVVRLGERGEVGLRFVESCPDDVLLAATLGIDMGPTLLGGPRPESVDDFIW